MRDLAAHGNVAGIKDSSSDPELFAVLRERVLPDLVEYSRTHGNTIRIWSAGCATGEEAYSLAMLLCDR